MTKKRTNFFGLRELGSFDYCSLAVVLVSKVVCHKSSVKCPEDSSTNSETLVDDQEQKPILPTS